MDAFNSTDGKPGDSRGFLHKRIGRAIKGTLTGGVTGGIAGFFGGGNRPTLQPQIPHQQTPTPFANPRVPLPGIVPAIERLIPGGNTGFGPGGGGVVATHAGGSTEMAVNAGVCAPAGFHKAKGTYTRKIDPCQPYTLSNLEIVPKGTFVQGKARKRNASNGTANNHAISRLKLAEGQAVKLLKAVGYRSVSKNTRRR